MRHTILVFLLTAGSVAWGIPLTSSGLDQGYRQMYNLEFADAHNTFAGWKQAHPEDPMGPVSNAAAYLFAEFDRLHTLSDGATRESDTQGLLSRMLDFAEAGFLA